jgi:NADH:ubiquinone oxidoreductase subunit 6 (subunit J)
MVLFIFVIMLLNLSDDELGERRITLTKGVSALAVVGLFFAFVGGIVSLGDKDPMVAGEAQAGKTVETVLAGIYPAGEVDRMVPLTRVNGAVVDGDYQVAVGDTLTFGTTGYVGLVRFANPPSQKRAQQLGATGADALPASEAEALRADTRKWAEYGTIERVGQSLFTKWLFPFEITGLLLFAAIVGAVVIAKRRL